MTAQAQRGKKSLTKTLGNYSFILIFAVILIAYLIINGGATTLSGVMNILRHSAVVGIMAFGMGLVIITGGIDLSVGSMLAMIGGLGVVAFNATSSVFVTLLTVLAVGCVLGFFNGILIGKVKMPRGQRQKAGDQRRTEPQEAGVRPRAAGGCGEISGHAG